jgi:hypothetical protein
MYFQARSCAAKVRYGRDRRWRHIRSIVAHAATQPIRGRCIDNQNSSISGSSRTAENSPRTSTRCTAGTTVHEPLDGFQMAGPAGRGTHARGARNRGSRIGSLWVPDGKHVRSGSLGVQGIYRAPTFDAVRPLNIIDQSELPTRRLRTHESNGIHIRRFGRNRDRASEWSSDAYESVDPNGSTAAVDLLESNRGLVFISAPAMQIDRFSERILHADRNEH